MSLLATPTEHPVSPPTIFSNNGKLYLMQSNVEEFNAASFGEDGYSCENFEWAGLTGHPLDEVSIPFSLPVNLPVRFEAQ